MCLSEPIGANGGREALGYCILPQLTSNYVSSTYCSQSATEPTGTFFLHASHNLRSNHILVQEFILTVSEEHPLERAVSDKCEIESFAANGLSPGRWCCRQQQSQETSELSEAPLFHYTSFLSESLACFESCLAIVWPPKVVIG